MLSRLLGGLKVVGFNLPVLVAAGWRSRRCCDGGSCWRRRTSGAFRSIRSWATRTAPSPGRGRRRSHGLAHILEQRAAWAESVIRYDGTTFVPCNWVICIESRLFRRLAVAVEDLARPWRRRDEPDPSAVVQLDQTMRAQRDRAAAIWRRNVRTAHAVAKANDAAYVIVLHATMRIGVDRAEALAAAAPSGERLAGFVAELLNEAYFERINHLYDRLQAHCAALEFYIDLSRIEHLPPLAAELYADPHHPTSDGNRIIAEQVVGRL